ncbi:MAG: hypothetical protein IPO56_17050 [Flavobacteriales bacterium]|nr:hypothetical protein [Flavobacteriales bacterium]MBK9629338.1 hypothetical protein [Flavobacteriales bacterium]
MGKLNYDYDPRGLVRHIGPDPDFTECPSTLSAIYVPTTGRPRHVNSLLNYLRDVDVPIYLLVSKETDVPESELRANISVLRLREFDAQFTQTMGEMKTQKSKTFGVPLDQWDLPQKRNYALWHSAGHGYKRILLLDDDIRGLGKSEIQKASAALCNAQVSGFFVDQFPDTSVIGHIELALGEPVSTFMSGSCLFLDVTRCTGFFPTIYNEDWIFMAPSIELGQACSLGQVSQEEYDPFISSDVASFQEPGEILGDGLFSLIAAGAYTERHRTEVWDDLLAIRYDWLIWLSGKVTDQRHRLAIAASLDRFRTIGSSDCVAYIHAWEYDRETWVSALFSRNT